LLGATSETYTIYATADDGVRLWLNGVLLIDAWKNEAATTYSANVTLVGGQLYDLRVEYYQDWGGATAILSWSSPSIVKQVIPQSQLFLPGT
jgi:hypothetical protein